MIRHSIQTGIGRGRPELSRLSEGISSTLRQFSIAQARCAPDNNGATPSPPASSRQRSAAAANELLSMNSGASSPSSAPKRSSNNNRSASPPSAAGQSSAPKVISINTLRGGSQGRFAGFRKVSEDEAFPGTPTYSRSPSGPTTTRGGIISGGIIRGGFRGRGGGNAFAAGRPPRDGESGGGGFRPAARGRGRGRGRGGSRGSDDRPVQKRRGNRREERIEQQDYARFKASGADEEPELTSYNQAKETGVDLPFQPTAPKDLFAELAAYAPAVGTGATPLAQSSTIITQARMLGGGRSFHPDDWPTPVAAKELYQKGHGVFFPSAEAKTWANRQTRRMEYQNPPKETTTAVLDAALLGKYDGPKFSQPGDTIGTVASYVKRQGTWNAAAERDIEAKVKSMLPVAKGPAKTQVKRA
ncbi:hypothetical protein TruAng_008740 [Truncatella angustata]|nr:hypothetical protein TruAng_008740 [Truncatella angustata]